MNMEIQEQKNEYCAECGTKLKKYENNYDPKGDHPLNDYHCYNCLGVS